MNSLPRNHGRILWTVIFSVIANLFLATLPALAGSIFDDNWTPPTRKTPGNGTRKPPEKSIVTPTTASVGETQTGAVAPARRAIPGKLDQTRSRDNLNLIFADASKDRTLAGQRKLAGLLFEALAKTADNPADQYVLLGGALKAGREGGSLRLCVQAADLLSQRFEVDDVALKADAALNMNLRGGGSADAAENAAVGIEVLDLLIADENFTAAVRLSGLLRGLIPVVPSAAPAIKEKTRQFEALRQKHDHFIQKLELLKTRPDDTDANLVVGEYYCLQRDDWKKGLPYLAKGSDADMQKAADDELTGVTKVQANELLGDNWWVAGEKQPHSVRAPFFAHAASFYKIALASATGLGRIKMEQRIALVMPTGPDGAVQSESLLPKDQPASAVSSPAADPVQPGTVWSDRDKSLSITSREGDVFHGSFLIGNGFNRQIVGTVKNGQLSWLAKDVIAIKGGPGGDNVGTINGRQLDFKWRDPDGRGGTFILFLKIPPALGASPGGSGKGADDRSHDAISHPTMLQISHRIEAMYLRRNKGGRGGFFVGGDKGAPGHPGSKAEMDSLLALVRSVANQTAPISAEDIAEVQKAIARTKTQLDSDALTTNPGGTGEEAAQTLKQWLDQIAGQLRDG